MKNILVRFVGFAFLTTAFISSQAMAAGTCEWLVTRTACKGKEAESYAKCAGKAKCEPATKKVSNEEACVKAAESDCSNSRLDITDSKDIRAKFDGKDVHGGKNVCKDDRKDFHGCK